MARIQIVSDLHTEFWGEQSLDALDPVGVDVLVVAGDLTAFPLLETSLERLSRRYSETPVVYVLGNHELYDGSPTQAKAAVAAVAARCSNLHVLDGSTVTLDGLVFAGGTLWFPHDPACDRYRRGMSDFEVIDDFEPWVYEENARHVAFLAGLERTPDVIVTHHLPVASLTAAKWRGSPLNRFFVGDAEAVLARHAPKLWLFGHTHDPIDEVRSGTRFVCNPRGYPGEGVPFRRDRVIVC